MKKIDDPLLENLSPLAIMEISENVRRMIAEPYDAIRLMLLFCDLVEKDEKIPQELLHHFKDVFNTIAHTNLSADRALGIKRSNNRPPASKDKDALIAHWVLQYRLKGNEYSKSVSIVADENEIGTTKVKNAWSRFKEEALHTESMLRVLSGKGFSETEKKLMDKIFKGQPFYNPFYSNT